MRRIDGWLFAPASSRRLAVMRIGLCSLLAFRLATGPFLELAGQPEALFRPISFMRLLDSMPPREVVLPLQVLGVALALLAAAGFRARATVPAAWGCAVFLNGMATSIGKVVHNDVVLLLCMVPLLASPSSEAWSLDARRRAAAPVSVRYGWPVRTAVLVAIGAYFFAGLQKLIVSGPAWVTSENLRWVLYAASDSLPAPNAAALFIAGHGWLAYPLAAGALGIELGAPLIVWRKWVKWLFVAGAASLHFGIWLTMRLDYSAQMGAVLVVMAAWAGPASRSRRLPSAPDGTMASMNQTLILYDNDCGFCRWSLNKILAWDRDGRFRPLALQSDEAGELLSAMEESRMMASWHLIDEEGRIFSGGAAAAPLFRGLRFGTLPALIAEAFPGLAEAIYQLVARNRDRLGALLGEEACAVDPAARPAPEPPR